MRTLLTILALGFAILAYGWGSHRPPVITVENRSGVALDDVALLVGEDAPARAALGVADGTGQSVPLRREGRARLELRFADGSTRVVDAGWFSPAARQGLRVVVVSPDSVRLEAAPARSQPQG